MLTAFIMTSTHIKMATTLRFARTPNKPMEKSRALSTRKWVRVIGILRLLRDDNCADHRRQEQNPGNLEGENIGSHQELAEREGRVGDPLRREVAGDRDVRLAEDKGKGTKRQNRDPRRGHPLAGHR